MLTYSAMCPTNWKFGNMTKNAQQYDKSADMTTIGDKAGHPINRVQFNLEFNLGQFAIKTVYRGICIWKIFLGDSLTWRQWLYLCAEKIGADNINRILKNLRP